jgi:signal transduction histidine kinase
VLIEVQDECGGLPAGEVDELFRPFEQRSADRTRRWGVEANGGRIHARNLAGVGCVFTVDLPRVFVPAVAQA